MIDLQQMKSHFPAELRENAALKKYMLKELSIEHWDTEIVRQCAEVGRKKGKLKILLGLFETLETPSQKVPIVTKKIKI